MDSTRGGRQRGGRRWLPVWLAAIMAVGGVGVPVLAQSGNSPQSPPTHTQILASIDGAEAALAQQHDDLAAVHAPAVREPINLRSSSNVEPGGNTSFVDVFTVPDDRYLVIEYVSFRAFGAVSPDRLVALRVITTAGGNRVDHRVSPAPLISTEIGEQEGGSMVRLYADPGSTLTFIAERGCCSQSPTVVNVGFSGYLTDRL